MSETVFLGLATIVAIVVGPILAVRIDRLIESRRAAEVRKMDIFRTLMRTRRMPIHFDHVGALNLVEVEFIGNKDVVNAWKDYLNNLTDELPPVEQKDKYDAATQKRQKLLTNLLWEIAIVLKLKVQQLDILEGNYLPKGWVDDELEQRLVRRQLLNVLSGRAHLVVRPDDTRPEVDPFPPAPTRTAR